MRLRHLPLIPFLLICCHKGTIEPAATTVPIAQGDLTVSPLDESSFKSLVPLGSLNPSSHVFPTDHLYFYLADKTVEVPVYAPGDLTIYRVSENKAGVGTLYEITDYALSLGSDNSYLQFSHISRLSDIALAGVDFSKAECDTYTLGNGSIQKQCHVRAQIQVHAGDIIGYCGKTSAARALDMGLYQKNIAVCPIEYYTGPVKEQLVNRFSSFDGTIKRTSAPVCGTVDQNIENTAQGIWLTPGMAKYPESNHIALVHDNIDPTEPAFSIGLFVTGLQTGVYTFSKQSQGFINRDFPDVKADGNIYCYNYRARTNTQEIPNTSILLRLDGPKSLKIEKRNCDCSCVPYTFTAPQPFIKE